MTQRIELQPDSHSGNHVTSFLNSFDLLFRSEWCQAYKLHRKSQKENVVRESSRDSGVDVTSRDTPTLKNEKNNFKNEIQEKSQIPKYKFNQKKYNLRKHIQKV